MPMEIHVRDGGVWRKVSQMYVREGGLWRAVTEGHVRDGGTWRQFFLGTFEQNITIAADETNFSLRQALTDLGWSGTTPVITTVTINSGVTVGSTSSGIPAFDVDENTAYPAGSLITVINNGRIIGCGGAGGAGGTAPSGAGGAGEDGGTALFTGVTAITLTNTGVMAGGSGGGGGGGAGTGGTGHGGGGGGGDGFGSASGGAAGGTGAVAGNASDAAVSPGRGGGGTGQGASGQDGGGSGTATQDFNRFGLPGIHGSASGQVGGGRGGRGGRPGRFVQGNDLITWTATGTRYGAFTPFKSVMTMISEMGWSTYNRLCIDFGDTTCYNDHTLVDQTVTDLSSTAFVLNLGDSVTVDANNDPLTFHPAHNLSFMMFGSGNDKLSYSSGSLTSLQLAFRNGARALFWAVVGAAGNLDGIMSFNLSGGASQDFSLAIDTTTDKVRLNWWDEDITSTNAIKVNEDSDPPNIILCAVDEVANTIRILHSNQETIQTVSAAFVSSNSVTLSDFFIGHDAGALENLGLNGQLFAAGVLNGVAMTDTELTNFYLKLKERYCTPIDGQWRAA